MENKFRVELRFEKNRHTPQYGTEAFIRESHSIYVLYGKNTLFNTSLKAVEFILSKINDDALNKYDAISYTIWKGNSGNCYIIKESNEHSDSNHNDIEYANKLFNL